MATIIGIMDRGNWHACTDVMVVVDPLAERLLWVPRDLWCDTLENRINTAFRSGGHSALMKALREHDIHVEHSVCIRREAVEQSLAGAEVTVNLSRTMAFWYPLAPTRSIEEGRKLVTFRPPAEKLSGERIHQWLGARFEVAPRSGWIQRFRAGLRYRACRWSGRRYRGPGMLPDLDRIDRQKEFVRELLAVGFDFAQVTANPEWISLSDPGALEEPARVEPHWCRRTLDDVEPRLIRSMQVLVNRGRRPVGVP